MIFSANLSAFSSSLGFAYSWGPTPRQPSVSLKAPLPGSSSFPVSGLSSWISISASFVLPSWVSWSMFSCVSSHGSSQRDCSMCSGGTWLSCTSSSNISSSRGSSISWTIASGIKTSSGGSSSSSSSSSSSCVSSSASCSSSLASSSWVSFASLESFLSVLDGSSSVSSWLAVMSPSGGEDMSMYGKVSCSSMCFILRMDPCTTSFFFSYPSFFSVSSFRSWILEHMVPLSVG